MKFRVSDKFARHSRLPNETLVILRRDSWDDFTFKTLFEVELLPAIGDPIKLGPVKILKAGQQTGQTPLVTEFETLGNDYCSLGQDIEYYENLSSLADNERRVFLKSLRDAATDKEIAAAFESEEGWQMSLLRFGQAEHTLASAGSLLYGTAPLEGVVSFTHQNHEIQADMRFDFDDSGALPGRCKVLIGYNGVGKTRLLADVARATSKVGLRPNALTGRGSLTFSAVVAVSYSAFDTFELPPVTGLRDPARTGTGDASNTTFFGYTYCGLRQLKDGQASSQLKSIQELNAELSSAFREACTRDPSTLSAALGVLELDPSFGRSGLRLSGWVEAIELSHEKLEMMSAGQKIVLNIVVQLAAHLRSRSLVLIDEPETHLHPSLLAALLRATQRLLDGFDSFAIIATHSPVVIQEVPAKDVKVIERFGTSVRAVDPQLETFGAGLGELTHEAFGLDNTVSDYRAVIRELADTMSLDELEALFPLGLSSQARALAVLARRATRNS